MTSYILKLIHSPHLYWALAVFAAAYLLNAFYITVLYHRGLAHSAVRLRPWSRALLIHTGNWITGLDPKGWACMHRLHHLHSDTAADPHSPQYQGVLGVMLGQLKSYERVLVGLIRSEPEYAQVVRDLDFEVSWLNRHKLWMLPYVAHALIAIALGFATHSPLIGAAYWLGMMSHPLQGWLVNAFAHLYGYRNFDNGDDSRNNTLVAWLVFGEGYQNNHHARPAAAKFSVRWFEIDMGYGLCHLARRLGMIEPLR